MRRPGRKLESVPEVQALPKDDLCRCDYPMRTGFGLLLPQRLGDGFFKRLASQVAANNLAFPVQQERRGNALDAVLLGQLVAPAFTVEVLPPGYILLLDEALQPFFILVEADPDDFKTLVVMLFVRLHDRSEE